uniref:Thymus, brain and testes associated n=1 Tax=Periophthalmus magnuspinnatus TaxID=409849 RepID=A0A3B4AZZ9_9GOBI
RLSLRAGGAVDLPRLMSRSSARFGSLSHHSFFSRHNPHPSRVRHIQGLNGRPVCSVRDDWFGSSPLFPHPLLKANIFRRAPDLPLSHIMSISAGFLSERWREELKEGAALKTEGEEREGGDEASCANANANANALFCLCAQVLELLCQILQTDSLSNVQQWLLLAGQRGQNHKKRLKLKSKLQ